MLQYTLISIALAMDCFSVSIATGIAARRILWTQMTLMTLAFGIFQGGMTLIGYHGTLLFSHWITTIDHWIAFTLLLYLGTNMISTLWRKSDNDDDTDTCRLLQPRNIPILAIATSIDALAIGITLACVDSNIWQATPIIALGSSLFTILGLALGLLIGKHISIPAEPLGGIVLIGIGIKILIEHLS